MKNEKTYTVRQYTQNICPWQEIWNCGHKHKSLVTATKCLDGLDETTRSIGAEIVCNETGEYMEPEWND